MTLLIPLALAFFAVAFALGFSVGARSVLRRWNEHLSTTEALLKGRR